MADSSASQEVPSTPDFTQLTYTFVFESYLQDLEGSSRAYKKLLAATSISVEERRLAFEEFLGWWTVEKSMAEYHGQVDVHSDALIAAYFDQARRTNLPADEAKRVRLLEIVLRQGLSEQAKFVLSLLATSEFDLSGRPLELLSRLRAVSEALKLLMRDEPSLPAAAAMTNLIFDMSESDLFDGATGDAFHAVAIDLLQNLQIAIRRSEGIDILAPQNLIGGAVVVRLAAPLLARSLTLRFMRFAWWKTPVTVKVPAVTGTLAAAAGLSQLKFSSRRRRIHPESEIVLLRRSEEIAVSRRP